MIRNMSNLDRLARIIFGFGLIAVSIAWNSFYSSCALGVIGTVALITGMVSRCPLYAVLKINSRNAKYLH